MLVLIVAEPYNVNTQTTDTLRWAWGKFITKSGDTPSRTPFLNCITRRPNYVRSLHGEGRTLGSNQGVDGTGSFALGNGWNQAVGASRLDSYKTTYRFNGRSFYIYTLSKSAQTFAEATLWMRGTFAGEPDYGEDEITFTFESREGELSRPILTATYGGTNGTAGEIIDGFEDIKGQFKQRIWGNPRDATGQLVHPGYQIWRVNDGPFKLVEEIRDGGLATFSVGSDYANATALASATLGTTDAATCYAQGLVRLGSQPASQLRFDLQTDDSTAADIIAALGSIAGWGGSDFTSGTLSALASSTNAPLQLLVTDGGITIGEAMDAVMQSVGGHRIHERAGTMTLGILVAPSSAAAVKTLNAANSGDLEIRQSSDTNRGLPPWKTRVGWYRRWAALSRADFVGAVTASSINDQSQTERIVEATASTVLAANIQSEPFDIPTLHVDGSSAAAFASVQQDLRGVIAGRDFFYVPAPASKHTDLDPGDVVLIKRNRYGLSNGKPVVITTLNEDLEENETGVEAFG